MFPKNIIWCLLGRMHPGTEITADAMLWNHTSVVHCIITQAYLIYSSSVAAGAQSGIEECKYQFAWDRWNCPERALQLSTHSSLRSGKSWPPHPPQNNSTPSQIFPHAYEAEIPAHGKHGRFSKVVKKWYATVCFFFFLGLFLML